MPCTALLHGLWQTSWTRVAPDKAVEMMYKVWAAGFTTFDAADHYGPAEDLLGLLHERLRREKGSGYKLQAFTKWCPRPGVITRAAVDQAVSTSLRRMKVDCLDSLQFHWWDYSMHAEMMNALTFLNESRKAGRINQLALTNFDTKTLQQILAAGIPISSNQVQYSLIDMRPAKKMTPLCLQHGVKLLTYGTLAGGLLSDKWLGRPEPCSKADIPTPSLGKYFNMIKAWGSWALFQELLVACRIVADRHGVGIAHVAIRWVLDQPAVAGVIVGLHAGISEHAEDNKRVFGFALTEDDKQGLQAVLGRGRDLLSTIGDCGDEYR